MRSEAHGGLDFQFASSRAGTTETLFIQPSPPPNLSLTASTRPMPNGLWSGSCGGSKDPTFSIFFYEDSRLKFDRHIVHEKRITKKRICMGQLTQRSFNGWQQVTTGDNVWQRVVTGDDRSLQVIMNFNGYQWVTMGYNRWQWMATGDDG